MVLRVNMSNVNAEFALLENNKYMAFFAKYESKRSPNTGNLYFNNEFHIDGELHPTAKGRRMWGVLGAGITSLWAVKEFLITMGYPSEVLDEEDGSDPTTMSDEELAQAIAEMLDKVVGGRVYLDVATEDYEKKLPTGEKVPAKRNVIADYVPVAA